MRVKWELQDFRTRDQLAYPVREKTSEKRWDREIITLIHCKLGDI